MVIIDSDIMNTAYNVKTSPEKAEVERLVGMGRAATVGIVMVEVLRGARTDQDFARMSEEMQAMAYVETGIEGLLLAGRILHDLKRRGEIIPMPDAVIAAHALRSSNSVYSHDHHFERIAGLRIHQIGDSA